MLDLVAQIPVGKVASYGMVGARLSRPTTGRIVGRWLYLHGHDTTWWRVVSSTGHISLAKLDAAAAQDQMLRLRAEGVNIDDLRVDRAAFVDPDWDPEAR